MTMRVILMMEKREIKMFMVEMFRITKANIIEIIIPLMADLKNSCSVLIQVKYVPPVIIPLFKPAPDAWLISFISFNQSS